MTVPLSGSDPSEGLYLLFVALIVVGICAAVLWWQEQKEQRQDWKGEYGSRPVR